jgi:hypothetical protein
MRAPLATVAVDLHHIRPTSLAAGLPVKRTECSSRPRRAPTGGGAGRAKTDLSKSQRTFTPSLDITQSSSVQPQHLVAIKANTYKMFPRRVVTDMSDSAPILKTHPAIRRGVGAPATGCGSARETATVAQSRRSFGEAHPWVFD